MAEIVAAGVLEPLQMMSFLQRVVCEVLPHEFLFVAKDVCSDPSGRETQDTVLVNIEEILY